MARLKMRDKPAWCDIHAIRTRRRWQGRKHVEVRFIKVRNGGPKSGRWIPLAKFTWEQMHGTVPDGYRVVHLDGNTMNDNPANYGLMTSGEFIKHCHALDPAMSEDNRRGQKRREATAQHNRERGALLRHYRFLPHYWYPVDHDRRIVFNTPFKSRRLLFLNFGVQVPKNGVVPEDTGLSVVAVRGRSLAQSDAYRGYRKEGNSPCCKSRASLVATMDDRGSTIDNHDDGGLGGRERQE